MPLEDRLRKYVKHVRDGGDPSAPDPPLSNSDHGVWVSWLTDDSGNTRLDIRVDDERYGCFLNGRRIEPSWEGGVDGPDVSEWKAVREL